MSRDDVWQPPTVWSTTPATARSMAAPLASATVAYGTPEAIADTIDRIRLQRPWTQPERAVVPAIVALSMAAGMAVLGPVLPGILLTVLGIGTSAALYTRPGRTAHAIAHREVSIDLFPGNLVVRAGEHSAYPLGPNTSLVTRPAGHWLVLPNGDIIPLIGPSARAEHFVATLNEQLGLASHAPTTPGPAFRITRPPPMTFATLATTRRYAALTTRGTLALVVTFFIAAIIVVWLLTASALNALALSVIAALLFSLVTLIPMVQFPFSLSRGRTLSRRDPEGLTLVLGERHLTLRTATRGVSTPWADVRIKQTEDALWLRMAGEVAVIREEDVVDGDAATLFRELERRVGQREEPRADEPHGGMPPSGP